MTNQFALIKSQITILDVVNRYTALKQAGVYWKGICPFHSEKTASFTVSPHKEIFYCFGCHKGGDVITFISQVEQCSPVQAVQHLAQLYSIDLPTHSPAESPSLKHRYTQLCEYMAAWCHQKLLKSPVALGYLKKRGISLDSIKQFTLGYFPGGLNEVKSFIHAMNQHTILVDDLMEAHILLRGKTVLYSPFEDRIIFPITDHLGQLCGFGGRIFKQRDTRAKYYNSKENDYFNKGSLLFGINIAKQEIQTKSTVFLVEGYTDCIAMVQHGFTNTVASLGTACTAAHLKYLSRHAHRAYVLYDGDSAGQQALLRLAQLCWQASMELHVVSLPAQEDPASLLTQGKELDAYIAQAQDIFTFFVHSLAHGFSEKSLKEKLQLVRTITRTIARIEDPLLQDIVLNKAAAVLSIPFETLKRDINEAPNQPFTQKEVSQGAPTSLKTQEVSLLEKKIFSAIINNIQLLDQHHYEYLMHAFSEPLHGILHKLYEIKNKQLEVNFGTFFDTLEEEEKSLVSMICVEQAELLTSSMFMQLMQQLQKNNWKHIIKDITLQLELAQKQGDTQRVKDLIHKFETLKKPYYAIKEIAINKGYRFDDTKKEKNSA